MYPGYNTNGFADHRLEDTLSILGTIGYRGVALTLTRRELDPPGPSGVDPCLARLVPLFERSGLRVTIEMGGRFMLDPWQKHQPTLISRSATGRRRRLEFLRAAIDVAATLNAESMSLWSGAADDDATDAVLMDRLAESLRAVLDHAVARRVRVAFEPEPGMFIDTMERFEELAARVDHPLLGLTLDVGHLYCTGEDGALRNLHRWQGRLWNLHIEDMRRGVHEHLPFGHGDVDFDAVFAGLRAIDYRGPVHVELSRCSHDAVETARRSFAFLSHYMSDGGPVAATD